MTSLAIDLPMPPMQLRIMKEDDEALVRSGTSLARLMMERGLKADGTLLDVGSCYGRLPLGLLAGTDFHGTYIGFDVLRKQVRWCKRSLTPVAPNFRFHHIDVRNDRYNPSGTVDPLEVRFPAKIGSIDTISLFSIFTHFYRADIEHYLGEFKRVLKPGGIAVTTWFVYDDARLPLIQSDASVYPMIYELDAHTRYNDPDDPLRAIAFEESLVRSMVEAAGLEIVTIDRGTWCGEPGTIFQDLIILRRPGALKDRVRARLGHVKRRVQRTVEERRARRSS
ncbi:methyltransferase domain-containing protein [Aeromicrobium sp. S22]|uniref:class I SAM-dependent methyltransferase n=1 Tax=Aeromicrobium sp. S22 TaxID=2662029 RepID=UPI00129ECBE5|nr:class I SAM-dependent methyltransferase [Aeromicrobium sp. S22]MRK01814.1 methyltransferase domain-containing protein [Aeromicrobium sp. S22]